MFRLVHHFLLREFEERGRAEGRADGEESQGRVLGLAVLAVEHLDSPSDVQPLRASGWRVRDGEALVNAMRRAMAVKMK